MQQFGIAKLAGVLILIFLHGCGVLPHACDTRCYDEVKLQPPTSQIESSTPKATLVIMQVVDDRVFSLFNGDRKVPSLSNRATSLSFEVATKRAVARQGIDNELGDLFLTSEGGVTELVYANFRAAATEAGFTVLDSADRNPSSAIPIVIHVKDFWGWAETGFFAMTMTSRVSAEIDFAQGNLIFKIQGLATEKWSMTNVSAWKSVFGKALEDFRVKAVAELGARDFGKVLP